MLALAQLALRQRPVVVPVAVHDRDPYRVTGGDRCVGRLQAPDDTAGRFDLRHLSHAIMRSWVASAQHRGNARRLAVTAARSRSMSRPTVIARLWLCASASAMPSHVSAAIARSWCARGASVTAARAMPRSAAGGPMAGVAASVA